ncbi:MAG: rhodanese-like domain-containing protein [Chloroflexota bacterium]|nr:rhodanese-like domain-containing protein [Chloroflexota bacterium]
MGRRTKITSNIKTTTLRLNVSWLWFGLLLVLLAFSIVSLPACSTAPAAVVEAPSALTLDISVDEAYELYQDGVFFLDVRTQEEWDDFHAPGTTLIPLDELESHLNELPDDEPIVVVCRSGNRSQVGRDILLSNGFEQTSSMAGGLITWREAGYPIE